jgi:sugar lactone lactonase YvrE
VTLRAATGIILIIFLAGGASAASKPVYELRKVFGEHGQGRNELESPAGLAVSEKGIVAVADDKRNAVVLFDEDGSWQRTIGAEKGRSGRAFDTPRWLCFDRRGRIWLSDSGNDRLVVLEDDGSIQMTLGSHGFGKGDFRSPGSVAASSAGRIYVADSGNRRIEIFSNRGEYLDKWSPGDVSLKGHLQRPRAIAYSPADDGSFWVVEDGSGVISRFDLDGNWKASVDVEKIAERKVSLSGIGVDGRFGWIFLLDSSSGTVLALNADGVLQAELKPEADVRPVAIAVNDHRDIFLADAGKQRVLYYERK